MMAVIRRDVWVLSAQKAWPDELLWYAKGIRAMQSRPLSDPTSWEYQSAVHGLANAPTPPAAPWNECQHASWYFGPWHRMYLYQFEEILRAAIVGLGGPADWALPYWNYERSAQARKIPPAFNAAKLPDQSQNPLRVPGRRPAVADGEEMPADFASSTAAMSDSQFITQPDGRPGGFGGPKTAFHHGFDGTKGDLERRPHDIIHGWVAGLMNNPDTAALDPIFWLHHANIDRLWETWRITTDANPTQNAWLSKKFKLRDKSGAVVQMVVGDVVDTKQLDYTYDSVKAVGAIPKEPVPMPSRSKPKTIAQHTEPLALGREGVSADLNVGKLPPVRAAVAGQGPRFYLRLADITGEANPDIIYGVYVNLPDDANEETRKRHRVGLVSFFGIEHTTKEGSKEPKPLSYSFDVTDVVAPLTADDALNRLRVSLLPVEGTEEPTGHAAVAAPPITVGTVAFSVASD